MLGSHGRSVLLTNAQLCPALTTFAERSARAPLLASDVSGTRCLGALRVQCVTHLAARAGRRAPFEAQQFSGVLFGSDHLAE